MRLALRCNLHETFIREISSHKAKIGLEVYPDKPLVARIFW